MKVTLEDLKRKNRERFYVTQYQLMMYFEEYNSTEHTKDEIDVAFDEWENKLLDSIGQEEAYVISEWGNDREYLCQTKSLNQFIGSLW